jgi:hypothetical protein
MVLGSTATEWSPSSLFDVVDVVPSSKFSRNGTFSYAEISIEFGMLTLARHKGSLVHSTATKGRDKSMHTMARLLMFGYASTSRPS